MKKRTKLKDRTLPNYTKGEEIANMVTHIIGGVIGIVALVLCVVFAAKNKKAVNDSRQTIADALNADVRDIYFTAGGSEADNWALIATAEAYESKGKHIITSRIEHHAILHTCDYLEKRGFEITYIDVDENGKIVGLF